MNRQFKQMGYWRDDRYRTMAGRAWVSPGHSQPPRQGSLSGVRGSPPMYSFFAARATAAPAQNRGGPPGRGGAGWQGQLKRRNDTPLSQLIRGVIGGVLARVRDADPEGMLADKQEVSKSQVLNWGWLPMLTLMCALGLVCVAVTYTVARTVAPRFIVVGADVAFLLSVVVIFWPTMVRLLSAEASRFERLGLVCVVGMSLYLVRVMSSPVAFTSFDEFLHWRTADDIARSGHLFTPNALLPVSAYHPGLEIVTNAFSRLGGLSTFQAGVVVIGVGRLVMVLGLFLLNEQLLRSARMAGMATMVYMTNPHFVFFDGQFGYESLALPLAVFVFFAMAPHQGMAVRLARLHPLRPFVVFAKAGGARLSSNLRWITLVAWIALAAVAVTHHVTDFFLVGLLLLWTGVYAWLRVTPIQRSNLAMTALLGVVIAVVYTRQAGNPVVGYLSAFLGNALHELGQVLTGTSHARQLFVSYNGQVTPLWQRLLTISSVALIMGCLPGGLLCLWHAERACAHASGGRTAMYRSNTLTLLFGLVALAYPLSQVFRFTTTGAELTDRAAAFLFLPIASLVTLFIAHFWPTRRLGWGGTAVITLGCCVVFMGGIVLAAGPSSAVLPGPYLVGADSRSIEPEGIAAASWSYAELGPDNRVATDRTNQILMATYGDQRVITSIGDGIDVSSMFFAVRFGPTEASMVRSERIRYLVVDLRMARGLPLLGYYFAEGEPGAFVRTRPVDVEALGKFNALPGANRVFDSGDIVIYDVGGISDAPEGP